MLQVQKKKLANSMVKEKMLFMRRFFPDLFAAGTHTFYISPPFSFYY